jgi:hypothetical protein
VHKSRIMHRCHSIEALQHGQVLKQHWQDAKARDSVFHKSMSIGDRAARQAVFMNHDSGALAGSWVILGGATKSRMKERSPCR